jgi:hypothetical protein
MPRTPFDKLQKMKSFLKDTVNKFIAPPALQSK